MGTVFQDLFASGFLVGILVERFAIEEEGFRAEGFRATR